MSTDFDFDTAFEEGVKNAGKTNRNGTPGTGATDKTADTLIRLYKPQPEGGGEFGGRDNALTSLVGILRARRFPFDVASKIIKDWNRDFCQPPIDERTIQEKAGRAWYEWLESDTPDAKPEDFKANPFADKDAWEFMTYADMEAESERLGGVKWVVDGVFPVGGLVYFSAPPAGAKTWLLLDLVRCLTLGGKWVDTFDVPLMPVLYIDEEMGATKMLSRLKKLGIGGIDKGFWYTNKVGVDMMRGNYLSRIVAFCKEKEIKVVIIDTLSRVHTLDENDNSKMKILYKQFQQIMGDDILLIVAHHDRKGGQGESNVKHDRMRGAGEMAASADMAYSVEKKGVGWFRLVTTKGRLVSEDNSVSIDFSLKDLPDDKIHITTMDAEERSAHKIDDTGNAICEYLSRVNEANVREIRTNIKASNDAITAALKQLEENGVVKVRVGENRSKFYSLAT